MQRSVMNFLGISVISQCNVDGSKVMNVSLLIWTTTPWSLVANKAICYRGDAEYSIVDTGNAGCRLYASCCVVATDLLSRYDPFSTLLPHET